VLRSQVLFIIADGFMEVAEYELSMPFVRAEMAIAESVGKRGKSQLLLVQANQLLGSLKEAEHEVKAILRHKDVTGEERVVCVGALAGVLRDQGRLGEALETAEEATALAKVTPAACVRKGHLNLSLLAGEGPAGRGLDPRADGAPGRGDAEGRGGAMGRDPGGAHALRAQGRRGGEAA
jgi:hypothetical protein